MTSGSGHSNAPVPRLYVNLALRAGAAADADGIDASETYGTRSPHLTNEGIPRPRARPRGQLRRRIRRAAYSAFAATRKAADSHPSANRAAHRTCGTVTVSDHFASWEAQGWTLGTLVSVHINVEVGGGMGTIDFPVANVTTTSK